MIVVDFSHLVMRNVFMNIDDITKDYNMMYHLVLQSILKVKNDFKHYIKGKNDRMLLAFDSKNSWRKEYFNKNYKKLKDFPEKYKNGYKGQRKLDYSLIDWDIIYSQVNKMYNFFNTTTDIIPIKVDKAEGDDIVFVIINENKDKNIVIVSSDKDYIQLLQYDNVKLYDPIKKKFINYINPKHYLIKQIIIGDKVDNIPAIKNRVGEKTAEKWLQNDFKEDLENNKDLKNRFLFNRKLIDLSKIPNEIYKEIKNELDKKINEYKFDSFKCFDYLNKEFKLRKMKSRINEFAIM